MFYKKAKLQRFLDEYIKEKRRVYPSAVEAHSEYLIHFVEQCDKELYDLRMDDISDFQRFVQDRYTTRYHQAAAMKAVSCFLRYYRHRGHKYLPTIQSNPHPKLVSFV